MTLDYRTFWNIMKHILQKYYKLYKIKTIYNYHEHDLPPCIYTGSIYTGKEKKACPDPHGPQLLEPEVHTKLCL